MLHGQHLPYLEADPTNLQWGCGVLDPTLSPSRGHPNCTGMGTRNPVPITIHGIWRPVATMVRSQSMVTGCYLHPPAEYGGWLPSSPRHSDWHGVMGSRSHMGWGGHGTGMGLDPAPHNSVANLWGQLPNKEDVACAAHWCFTNTSEGSNLPKTAC